MNSFTMQVLSYGKATQRPPSWKRWQGTYCGTQPSSGENIRGTRSAGGSVRACRPFLWACDTTPEKES